MRGLTLGRLPGQARPSLQQWRVELAAVWPLALPLAFVQVGNSLTGLVDTAIAGRHSELTLAATGLGAAVFLAGSVLGLGCGYGAEPFIAQAMGSGRQDDARQWLWQGAYASLWAALPLWGACMVVSTVLPVLHIEPGLAAQAHSYLLGRLPSLVPFCLIGVLRAYLQGAQNTRPIVISTIVMNLFNAVCDWALLFGDAGLQALGLPACGIPALGAFGLGLASTMATVLQAYILLRAVRKLHGATPAPRPKASRVQIGRILRVGLPAGLQVLAEVGIFALVGMVSGSLGNAAIAAHQSALMLVSCSFSACVGLGMAATVRVGRAVGRRDAIGVRLGGDLCALLSIALMLVSSVAMWVTPHALMRVMTDVPSVIDQGAKLLRIAALFQLADGLQAVLAGALRGAAITRWPFMVNVVAHWLLGLPLALFLTFYAHLGVDGLWWGLTFGLAVVALCLWQRFRLYLQGPIVPLEGSSVAGAG